MKTIHLQISDDSVASTAIEEMNMQIPDEIKSSPEFHVLFGQVTACVEDFSTKAKTLARSGTTIQVDKEFIVSNLKILISLEYPRKTGLLHKLKGVFKKS